MSQVGASVPLSRKGVDQRTVTSAMSGLSLSGLG